MSTPETNETATVAACPPLSLELERDKARAVFYKGADRGEPMYWRDIGPDELLNAAWDAAGVSQSDLTAGLGVRLNGGSMTEQEQRQQQREYRTVSYLVSTLANICAASPNMVIDALTGLLWDEEEAGQIKVANMPPDDVIQGLGRSDSPAGMEGSTT